MKNGLKLILIGTVGLTLVACSSATTPGSDVATSSEPTLAETVDSVMAPEEVVALLQNNFPALCGESSLLTGKTITFEGPLTGVNPDSNMDYPTGTYAVSSADGHLFNVLFSDPYVRGLLPADRDNFALWCALPPTSDGFKLSK